MGPASRGNFCVSHAISVVRKQGDKIRIGGLTPVFSGAHKWEEMLRKTYIPNVKCGEAIRNSYLTLAFSVAQKRVEILRNPYILEVSNAKAGRKSELAASRLRSQRPTSGRKYS